MEELGQIYWKYLMPHYLNDQVLLPLKYFRLTPENRKTKQNTFLHHFMGPDQDRRLKRMAKMYQQRIEDPIALQEADEILANKKEGIIKVLD